MENSHFNECLKNLFQEMESSHSFAESVSISGNFDLDCMSDIVNRGRNVLLKDATIPIDDDNKEYEMASLYDIFEEMGCSYDFSLECAETMGIDIDDMYGFLKYVEFLLSDVK